MRSFICGTLSHAKLLLLWSVINYKMADEGYYGVFSYLPSVNLCRKDNHPVYVFSI